MTIGFEVDTNIVVLSFLMKIFHSGGCEHRVHSKGDFEVFRGRVVGIIGLNKSNFRINWSKEMKELCAVNFFGALA